MNNLKGFKVYLAGAIEYSNNSVDWRKEISEELKRFGIISLNPHEKIFLNQIVEEPGLNRQLKEWMREGRYDEVAPIMKQIVRRDLRCVDAADFVIVNLEVGVPTYGTPHEVAIASLQRKPILFRINQKEDMALWLMGLINHKFIFQTFDEIIHYLETVNSAPIENLDPKYWKIFAPDCLSST